jgi:hypothetical protein
VDLEVAHGVPSTRRERTTAVSHIVRRGLAHTAAAAVGAACLLAAVPQAAYAAPPPSPTCSGAATTYPVSAGTVAVCTVGIRENNGKTAKGTQVS